MATTLTNLEGVLQIRDAGYKRGLDNAKKQAQGFRQTLGGVASGLNKLALVGAVAAVPVVLALKSAVKSANTYNRAMTNVHSLTGATGDAAKALNAEILRMGGATEHGPMKAAEAFYDIVSGVSDASTHMAILNASMRTATAGQADLTATTKVMVGIFGAYGFAADKATFVSDVLTRSVQTGVLSMDELASAIPNVTALGAELGLSFGTIAKDLAFMTKGGLSAKIASTQLRQVMAEMMKPSTAMQKALEGIGFASGRAVLEQHSLVDALAMLETSSGDLSTVFSSVEALQGALALVKDGAVEFGEEYFRLLDGATQRGEDIQNQSNQWERLDAKMKELSITVGNALAPSLLDLLDNHIIPGTGVLISFWQEGDNAQQILKGLAVIAGAIVFTKLVAGLSAVIGVMTTLMGVVTGLIGGLQALAAFGVVAATAGGAAIGGQLSNKVWGTGLSPRESGLTSRVMQQFGGSLDAGQFEEALFAGRVSSFGGGMGADFMARLMTLAADSAGRTAIIGNKYQQGTGTGAYSGNAPRPVGGASLGREVGYAMGGYTGAGSRNEVAGMVHRGEYVVPQSGALVLRSGEDGGAQVNVYGPVNVNADNADDFAREMVKLARSL